jgi:ornithine cyclodeaminase
VTTTQPIYLTWLNGPDVARLALSDDEILAAVETGLKAQGEGRTVIEPRVHLVPESSDKGHFSVLRGVVWPLGVAGVKIVGFVGNFERGLPSEMALLNLFDPRTGMPKAVLDASAITDMRTGAMTALGGKYLARKDARILGHIGARGTAYWNVRLLDRLFDFDEIRVHSRRPESRIPFGERLAADHGKPVRVVDDWESCVRGADSSSRLRACPRPGHAQDRVDQEGRAGDALRDDERRRTLADRHHGQDGRRRLGVCRKGLPFGALRPCLDGDRRPENLRRNGTVRPQAGARAATKQSFWHRGLSLSTSRSVARCWIRRRSWASAAAALPFPLRQHRNFGFQSPLRARRPVRAEARQRAAQAPASGRRLPARPG